MTHASATLRRSCVDATIKASFPPSSSTEGFRYFPARAPIDLPAHSDPVRLIPRTSSRERMYSLSDDEMMIFWYTPIGNPLSRKSSSMSSPASGVLDACL